MLDRQRYTAVLAKVAHTLVTEYGISDALFDLCDDVASLLGLRGVGVIVADDADVLRFAAASDDRIAVIEQLEERYEEGPCLEAYRRGEEVVADLTDDDVFPRFSQAAVEAGLKSVQAFPMRVHGHLIGALSLYGDDAVTLAEEEREAVRTLAAAAGAYILNYRAYAEQAQLAVQLQHALTSRVVIEQAKGIVAEQRELDMAAAFECIRTHARSGGRRLHAVAQDIVDGKLTL